MKLRWLIVEDALRDRSGHWEEYVTMFTRELRARGDDVDLLVTREAEPRVCAALGAHPVLPRSIWHRTGTGRIARLARYPLHAWATWRTVHRWLRQSPSEYDLIFVPTVSAHHALGWWPLVQRTLAGTRTRVLLFFIQIPAEVDPVSGRVHWPPTPSARLLPAALRRIASAVSSGRVILGAEPDRIGQALAARTGLPVKVFPQPVHRWVDRTPRAAAAPLRFACFGAARAEKGSDLLVRAIQLFLDRHPDQRVHFTLQWVDDFTDEQGRPVRLPEALRSDPRVTIISRYFVDNEYSDCLAQTDVMILPYRLAAYRLRGSRVAIEAAVNGIPVICTAGSTLADTIEQHGAGITFTEANVDDLVRALAEAVHQFAGLATKASHRQASARAYYSVERFRADLLAPTSLRP